MNVAYALWGSLCGASLEIWDGHLEELLTLFVAELHAHGGPRLDVTELKLHLDFYVATMGLATMIEAPALVLSRLPEAAAAHGPLDPVFLKDDVARGFLHVFTAFLHLWQRTTSAQVSIGCSREKLDARGQYAVSAVARIHNSEMLTRAGEPTMNTTAAATSSGSRRTRLVRYKREWPRGGRHR